MDARIVALAKVVKEKALSAARQGLAVGTHPVDCLVHITGSIKVGADSTTDVRGTIDYRNAFATVCGILVGQCKLRENPLTDELLRDLIGMAMRQGDNAVKIAEDVMETVETIERDCTKVTGTKPKKGTITTKLDYSLAASEQTQAA